MKYDAFDSDDGSEYICFSKVELFRIIAMIDDFFIGRVKLDSLLSKVRVLFSIMTLRGIGSVYAAEWQ